MGERRYVEGWQLLPPSLTTAQVLKHKATIMELLICLARHAKNERGYSGASRLLTRLLHNIGAVYPVDERFVNKIEWESQGTFEG